MGDKNSSRKPLTLEDAIKAIKYQSEHCISQRSKPFSKKESDFDKLSRQIERILNNSMR